MLISRGRGAIAASLSSSLFLEYRWLTSSMVGTKYEKTTGEICAKHTNCPPKTRFFANILLLSYNLYEFFQNQEKQIVHIVYVDLVVNLGRLLCRLRRQGRAPHQGDRHPPGRGQASPLLGTSLTNRSVLPSRGDPHRRSRKTHGGPPLQGRPQGDANQGAAGRYRSVMLSKASHLAAWRARPFAALRVTRFGNFSERLWGRSFAVALDARRGTCPRPWGQEGERAPIVEMCQGDGAVLLS